MGLALWRLDIGGFAEKLENDLHDLGKRKIIFSLSRIGGKENAIQSESHFYAELRGKI